MNKICLYNYTSNLNPQGTYDLLLREGYKNMPRDKGKMAQALADMVKKEGNIGLAKIIEIHPDKELLTSIQEPMKNCDGCEQMKSADATTGKKFALSEKTTNIIIVASAAVLIFMAAAITIRKLK